MLGVKLGNSSQCNPELEHDRPDHHDSTTQPDNTRKLSHLSPYGHAHMVDISHKKETARTAVAQASLYFSEPSTFQMLYVGNSPKGDVLAVARVAAIQAAKRTSDLIPLAHPGLGLTGVSIDIKPFPPSERPQPPSHQGSRAFRPKHGGIHLRAKVSCFGKTGVEMEALTSATVGMLTLYDMLKGVDKSMQINRCQVISKTGGKSGDWKLNPFTHKVEYLKKTGSASSEGQATTSTVETSHTQGIPAQDEADQQKIEDSPSHEDVPQQHEEQQETPDHNISEDTKISEDQIISDVDIDTDIQNQTPTQDQALTQDEQLPGQPPTESTLTDSQSPTQAETQPEPQQVPSDSSSSNSDVNHVEGVDDIEEIEEIRFHRSTRDIMSGAYPDRVDRQAFQAKRVERYADWARER